MKNNKYENHKKIMNFYLLFTICNFYLQKIILKIKQLKSAEWNLVFNGRCETILTPSMSTRWRMWTDIGLSSSVEPECSYVLMKSECSYVLMKWHVSILLSWIFWPQVHFMGYNWSRPHSISFYKDDVMAQRFGCWTLDLKCHGFNSPCNWVFSTESGKKFGWCLIQFLITSW